MPPGRTSASAIRSTRMNFSLPTWRSLEREPTAPFHAHAYDATNMVLDAIESVAQQGSDGSLLIGRQALRDALYATRKAWKVSQERLPVMKMVTVPIPRFPLARFKTAHL